MFLWYLSTRLLCQKKWSACLVQIINWSTTQLMSIDFEIWCAQKTLESYWTRWYIKELLLPNTSSWMGKSSMGVDSTNCRSRCWQKGCELPLSHRLVVATNCPTTHQEGVLKSHPPLLMMCKSNFCCHQNILSTTPFVLMTLLLALVVVAWYRMQVWFTVVVVSFCY